MRKPRVYQEQNGQKRSIEGSYALRTNNQVSFEVAAYDTGKSLVIDPTLSFSTYWGGSSEDDGFSLALDSSGNVVVAGRSFSSNFPILNAPQPHGPGENVMVVKINAALTQVMFSTIIGGSNRASNDSDNGGHTLALDSSGNIYLTGASNATDFPTTQGAFQRNFGGGVDAIAVKLKADGTTLLYSSFLGGAGAEKGFGLAADSAGNLYIMGYTGSANFPFTPGAFQTSLAGGFDVS